jgi:hypothetical protein
MKLIRKELTLCLNIQAIIFCFLSCTVAIPGWPSMIGILYPLSGLMTIFPRALADQDLQYTAMLPIRKGDVVKGKAWLMVIFEFASLLISVPFAVLKIFVFNPMSMADEPDSAAYLNSVAPTMGSYGYVLLAFAVFNFILLPWYFKNPQKVNWPPLAAFFVSMLVMGLGIGLEAAVYILLGSANPVSPAYWIVEAITFAVGFLGFIGLSFWGEKRAEKNFDKVDL